MPKLLFLFEEESSVYSLLALGFLVAKEIVNLEFQPKYGLFEPRKGPGLLDGYLILTLAAARINFAK